MTFLPKHLLVLSIGLMTSTPVFADVTGAQVWQNWKDYLGDLGFDVSASELQSDTVLDVTDIVVSFSAADSADSAEMILSRVIFQDQPDGSVVIGLPDTVPMAMTTPSVVGGSKTVTATFSQEQAQLVASGEVGNLTYQYAIPRIGMIMDTADGTNGMTGRFDLLNLSGTARSREGVAHRINQNGTASAININMQMKDGANRTNTAQFQLDGLTYAFDLTLPKDLDDPDYAGLIAAGMNISSNFTSRIAEGSTTSTDPLGTTVISNRTNDVRVNTSSNASGMTYNIAYPDAAITLQAPLFPMPIDITGAQTSISVAMPALATDEPGDFAVQVNLQDYVLSDAIWQLFDPTGQIARDPAKVVIDVTGKANRREPGARAQLGPSIGGAMRALNINKIDVSAAGAQLNGAGAFTFDSTDKQTFVGYPRPEGAIEFQLKGGTALLGTLVQLGLLPQQQMMLAQIVMGMFTIPIGDDHISSKLEVTQEGGILANGQPLPRF
ncbi:MAG: hypothetical protein AAF754_03965 [Pseudomonadota bacterium]